MGSEVIKSFLVGLGFSVDSGSLATFTKALASATLKVTALYTSIQVATGAVFKGITGIAEGFEKFGYEARLIAPAINKTLELRRAMIDAYQRAGIDVKKAAQQSVIFNFSLAKTKFALEAIYKSVGLKFIPLLTQQMDIFRSKLYANMPKIQAGLERFIKFLFKAFEATIQLGSRVWSILGRVWDFFSKLDEATNGWSTKILLAVAAWKLLNLAFLASPLGIILTGLLAILALYDDFKTFQEGGQSLIDWSKYIPIINQVKAVFSSLTDVIGSVFAIFKKIWSADFSGAFKAYITYIENLTSVFSHLLTVVQSVGGAIAGALGLTGALSKVTSFFGGGKAQDVSNVFGNPNAAPALASISRPSPIIGSSAANSQRVSQETTINVQGSADAGATAKAVSNEQSKVNFDMTRNLRGAVR